MRFDAIINIKGMAEFSQSVRHWKPICGDVDVCITFNNYHDHMEG